MPQAESHVQGLCNFLTLDLTRGYSLMQAILVCAAPKGRVFAPFWSEKRAKTLPILVWNRILFSRELRECMNIFIVSIPND